MNTVVFKVSAFVLLITIINEHLVDCKDTDTDGPKYYQHTSYIFRRTLTMPVSAHALIPGNYKLIPDETKDHIYSLFQTSSEKQISVNDFEKLQFFIIEGILDWKKNHNRVTLDKFMDNAQHFLDSVEDREIPEVRFENYQDAIDELYAPKEGDNSGDRNDDDDDDDDDGNNFTSADLRDKKRLDQMDDVILSLPLHCCWKVTFLRALLNKVPRKVQPGIEKSIISSIEQYLLLEDRSYQSELGLALSLSNVFSRMMFIIEKTYEFQKQNNEENPLADASLTQAQEDELMPLLSMEIPLDIKNCQYPDILEIGTTLFEPIQTQVKDLYNCLATYEEVIDEFSVWVVQNYLLITMLEFVEDRQNLDCLQRYLEGGFQRYNMIGKEAMEKKKESAQSSTESTTPSTTLPDIKNEKKGPDSGKGGVSASMSVYDWVTSRPSCVRNSSGVMNPGHSAKTLQGLLSKPGRRRLRIQQLGNTEIRLGSNVASGVSGIQPGMKHLHL